MVVDGNRIYADEGKALKNKADTVTRTKVTRVALGPSDSHDNWEDCEYGVDADVTEADKDAALARLGVEVGE